MAGVGIAVVFSTIFLNAAAILSETLLGDGQPAL